MPFTLTAKSDSPARITFYLSFKQLHKISEKLCPNLPFQLIESETNYRLQN